MSKHLSPPSLTQHCPTDLIISSDSTTHIPRSQGHQQIQTPGSQDFYPTHKQSCAQLEHSLPPSILQPITHMEEHCGLQGPLFKHTCSFLSSSKAAVTGSHFLCIHHQQFCHQELRLEHTVIWLISPPRARCFNLAFPNELAVPMLSHFKSDANHSRLRHKKGLPISNVWH